MCPIFDDWAGDDALGFLASEQQVDLMLMDIRMPGRTGIEVMQERQHALPSFPVIAMTGHVDQDAQTEFRCVVCANCATTCACVYVCVH